MYRIDIYNRAGKVSESVNHEYGMLSCMKKALDLLNIPGNMAVEIYKDNNWITLAVWLCSSQKKRVRSENGVRTKWLLRHRH